MQLGIVQGRLLKPVDNKVQEFPANWEEEFDLIKKIDLHHIEWCITKKSFANNVLDLNIQKYSKYISSICCDNIIDVRVFSKDFLEEQLVPVCKFALRNDIKSITLPLLEDSKIDNCVDEFIYNIVKISNDYELNFTFELESPYSVAKTLCQASNKFFLTYDTGNLTSCGYNHVEYIDNCCEFISTVHLKDRTVNPVASVPPTTGDTDFNLIFATLKKNKYNGHFTIQTSRGPVGDELVTIKAHKKLFEELYERSI